jgi:hypothetical protein
MKCPNCGGLLNEQAVCVDCGHFDAGAAEHMASVSRPANGPEKPKMHMLNVSTAELQVLQHVLTESRVAEEQDVLVIADKVNILLGNK